MIALRDLSPEELAAATGALPDYSRLRVLRAVHGPVLAARRLLADARALPAGPERKALEKAVGAIERERAQ